MRSGSKAQWMSLAAFLLILLFAGAADGLMDLLGPAGHLAVGSAVMAAAWVLVEPERQEAEP